MSPCFRMRGEPLNPVDVEWRRDRSVWDSWVTVKSPRGRLNAASTAATSVANAAAVVAVVMNWNSIPPTSKSFSMTEYPSSCRADEPPTVKDDPPTADVSHVIERSAETGIRYFPPLKDCIKALFNEAPSP